MKLRNAILPIVVVLSGSLFLSACSPNPGSSYPDLSNDKVVSALCGDDAKSILADVTKAADAPVNTGKRNALKEYKLDPKDEKATADVVAALTERATVACDAGSNGDDAADDQDAEDANDQSTVHAPSVLDDWSYPVDYVTEFVRTYSYSTQVYTFLDADTGKVVKNETFPVLLAGNNDLDKLWPDSIEGPIASKTTAELIADVLVKPDVCAQAAVGLNDAVWEAPNGTLISVKANNPWIKKWFPSNIDGVTAWAADVLSGDQLEQLRDAKKCALVGLLLNNLVDAGVHVYTTVMNYHVSEHDAATVYGLATDPFHVIGDFELNPYQYTGEFIVFEFQLKGWPSNCKNQILFNTGDGRFARPDCTPPPTTTGGGCTSGCGGTVCTTCTLDEKNPLLDPENQGNNLPGGGGQAPVQTDPVGAPAGGNPPGSYTAPAGPPADIPVGSKPGGDSGGADQSGGGLQ